MIETSLVVALEDRAQRLLPDYALHVFPSRDGRYLVSGTVEQAIVVFDRSGQVHTTVGTRGTKSSQFLALNNLVPGPDGSFLAYDSFLKRLSVLRADLRLLPPVAFPFKPAFARPDGSLVVARQIPTPDQAGYPIHVLDAGGKVIRSFGLDVPEYRSDLRLMLDRIVAPGADGSVWSIAQGRYLLERWDSETGKRQVRVDAVSTWFKEVPLVTDLRARPSPIIETLWYRDGLVWILGRDADLNWGPPRRTDINDERPFDLDEYNARYDWIVEVIDPRLRKVVAARRFRDAIWAAPTSPYVVTRQGSTRSGRARFEVMTLQVKASGR